MNRNYSERLSATTSHTVCNVFIGIPPLPAVGECHVKRASRGYFATFNAGEPRHFSEAFGRTPEEAESLARAKAGARTHVCTVEGCGPYPCTSRLCSFPDEFPCPKHFIADITGGGDA